MRLPLLGVPWARVRLAIARLVLWILVSVSFPVLSRSQCGCAWGLTAPSSLSSGDPLSFWAWIPI